MKPGTLPIELFIFATFRLPLQWVAADVPVDLTGYKIRM